MKRFTALVLAIVLSLASFTACKGEDSSQQSSTVTTPTVVRTNVGSEPDSLDPWQSAATDTDAIFHNVFEGLLLYNEKGALIPGLAESYVVSDDGLVYTFSLRKDVKFHNGKPMTSKDVLYTYESLAGMNGEKAVSSKFEAVDSIEAPDDYTFVIKLKHQSSAFLTLNIIAVLPEGYADQATKPVGTGPFKFVEYTPGQRVVLEKNQEYYDKDRAAKIDRAEIYIMSDASAVISALQSGQLDYAGVSAENADLLKDDFTIYNAPQNMVQIFALNNSVAPFDNIKVRQAINYVVDKQEIIKGAWGSFGTQLYSNFSPVMGVYYNDQLTDMYTVNIEKAKALMKEAGYEKGFNMTIRVPSNYANHIATAQILAQQLAQIGITVKIETIEWAAWLDEVYSQAKYEGTVIGLTGKLDPNDVLARYTTTYAKNFFKFSDAKYDELIEKAAVETDDTKRVEMYKECQKILAEQAAAVYICDPNSTIACRKDLLGYTSYPVGFMDFSKLYYEVK